MNEEDFSFIKQKASIDRLFANLLDQDYKLPELNEMDILEFLRLKNLKNEERQESRKTDSLFSAFGK